ncbi:MAG: hypothetical protein R6V35_03530 [Candidatus Nanohaloarchaea archaeon]
MTDDRFQGIGRNKIARMRPGIIEAASNYQQEWVRAPHIGSDYSSSRIGFNLEVLAQAGIADKQEHSSRPNKYRVVRSLEPAEELAEQVYRYKIIEKLASTTEFAPEVVEDLETFIEYDNLEKDGLINFHRGGYHDSTVWLFEELDLIKDRDNREFEADRTDIEYLLENRDEWRTVAESLGEGGGLPNEYIEEMQRYETRFPGDKWRREN